MKKVFIIIAIIILIIFFFFPGPSIKVVTCNETTLPVEERCEERSIKRTWVGYFKDKLK